MSGILARISNISSLQLNSTDNRSTRKTGNKEPRDSGTCVWGVYSSILRSSWVEGVDERDVNSEIGGEDDEVVL